MKNPIHLAIESIGAKFGGSTTGLINILEAAIEHPQIGKIGLFCSPTKERFHKLPQSEKLIEIAKPWIDSNYALRVLWYYWLLGLECRRIGADALLVSANFGRSGPGVPHITYVRQSLPFSQEALNTLSTTSRIVNRIRKIAMKASCHKAACVIYQSSVMNKCVTDAFHLDPTRVETIYSSPKLLGLLNSSELFAERNAQEGNSPRLLYVGSDYRYKMIDTAVDGIELIRRQFPGTELTLTLPRNHHYASRPGINCVGYLKDDQLTEAYKSADILVLPSLVESGPQPPIEAMSLGTPVLIADRPYAHDICGDAALFFDPLSPKDFAEKAILLLQDKELRDSLIQKGYALIKKRNAEKPYQKIIDICVDVALEARRKKGLA